MMASVLKPLDETDTLNFTVASAFRKHFTLSSFEIRESGIGGE